MLGGFDIEFWFTPAALISKGQMVFFEFWSGSHFLDFQPNLFLFLELGPLFEIYSGM